MAFPDSSSVLHRFQPAMQLDASYLQWGFFTCNCVWELFDLQLELLCLYSELSSSQWESASNKHLNGL